MARLDISIVLFFLITLTGCFEDKGAILAECQLKYGNNPKLDLLDIQENVILCMRKNGYIFQDYKYASVKNYKNREDFKNQKTAIETINNPCYGGNPHLALYTSEKCYKQKFLFGM